MVEAPLTLLQVQREGLCGHAVELLQATLTETPERLDAIDVALVGSELIIAVIDSVMFTVTDINQPVVTAPAIRVDDRGYRDATANNGLQSSLFTVWHDLGIDLVSPLQQAEDDGLARGSTTTFTAHATRAEVRFVNLNLAVSERRLTFALFTDATTYLAEDRNGAAMRKTGEVSCIAGT